jgi:hypothetical protein
MILDFTTLIVAVLGLAALVLIYICRTADADARLGMDPALRRVIDNDRKLTAYCEDLFAQT